MKKVDKDYRASELEESIRKIWRDSGAYAKTKEHRSSAQPFSFVDGPPYTTGSVHVGTAWNKILKDLFIRYKRMRGFNVRDQPGYDMHGLPIEVKVEQAIGTKNKGDIEVFGVEKFIEKCKTFANEFREKQTEEFKQLGVWMDWDSPYQTIDRSFISSVWWTLGEAYKKNLITKANRVLPWCPRCETALAEAEIEYWDETDPSIFVRFPLVDNPDQSIIIWTTTPWTIPGNIAAAVHPKEIYSAVEVKADKGYTEIFIVMKSLVDTALPSMGYPEYKIIGEVSGNDLVGKKYKHPLLESVPYQQTLHDQFTHSIVASDTVAKENTGIVHIAPGHGPEDFEIGKKYGLPAFCPVDEKGVFTADAGERYAGKPVNEGGKMVLNDLQDSGLLVKENSITHRYGHCWRCKTPIIYRTTEQWFLRIPEIKEQILRTNEGIGWYPEWAGSGRQKDWIINARDWCISRQRYWGTPLPIWICSCGETKVVSGYDELKDAAGFSEGMDLHRPWIDKLTFKCPKCSLEMKRVPDVMDVWFDSGACSWASMSYPDKKGDFEKWWPAEWITEAHDQTRGWFYSQLVLGTIVFGRSPFKSVLMHGWALGKDGRPMSKSEGNTVDPIDLIRSTGADSLRLYLLGAGAPWDDLAFQPDGPKQSNRFLNIFWNVYKFAVLYMTMDDFEPQRNPVKLFLSALKPEDRWILSRLEHVKADVTNSLDRYEPHEAARSLEKFMADDVSRWYVRMIRDRLWIEGESAEKMSAFAILYKILDETVLMIAPFAPHIAEEMYQNLDGEHPSVHMADWPASDISLTDDSVEQGMELVRELVEKISTARQSAKVNLRWPIKRIILKADADDAQERIAALKDILLTQTNVKEMQTVPIGEEWEEAILTVVPNPSAIGMVYRQWQSKIAVLLKSRPAKSIKEGVDKGEYEIGIEGQLVKIIPNMVSFTSSLPPDVVEVKFSHGTVYLDMEMTDDLEAEGYARESVRRVQQMRKDMKLDVEEFIDLEMACSDRLQNYLTQWRDYLTHETRTQDLKFDPSPKGDYIVEWGIEEESVSIGITSLKVKEMIGDLGDIHGLPLDKALKLSRAGFRTQQSLNAATDAQIINVPGIGNEDLEKIRALLGKKAVERYTPLNAPTQHAAAPQAHIAQQPARPTAAQQPSEPTVQREVSPAPQYTPPPAPQPAMQPISQPERTVILPPEITTPVAPAPTIVQVPVQPPMQQVQPAQAEIRPAAGAAAPGGTEDKVLLPSTVALEKSFTYLVEEDIPETSYKLFVNQLNIGMKGFCITRNYPAKIKARFKLGDIPLYWLSNVGKDNTIRPKDLEKLSVALEQFLANKGVVILLDGIEYLITNNNFITILRLIQSLRDQVAINQSILILAVNPSTLESHQLNLLEREIDGVIQG